MTKKKVSLEDLTQEALENARKDRVKTEGMLEKLNEVFDIDVSNTETLQAAMFVGGHVVKLLEQMTRANEQLVRLAQIKERQEAKSSSDEGKKITFDDLKKAKMKIRFEEEEKDDGSESGTDGRSDTKISKSVS